MIKRYYDIITIYDIILYVMYFDNICFISDFFFKFEITFLYLGYSFVYFIGMSFYYSGCNLFYLRYRNIIRKCISQDDIIMFLGDQMH